MINTPTLNPLALWTCLLVALTAHTGHAQELPPAPTLCEELEHEDEAHNALRRVNGDLLIFPSPKSQLSEETLNTLADVEGVDRLHTTYTLELTLTTTTDVASLQFMGRDAPTLALYAPWVIAGTLPEDGQLPPHSIIIDETFARNSGLTAGDRLWVQGLPKPIEGLSAQKTLLPLAQPVALDVAAVVRWPISALSFGGHTIDVPRSWLEDLGQELRTPGTMTPMGMSDPGPDPGAHLLHAHLLPKANSKAIKSAFKEHLGPRTRIVPLDELKTYWNVNLEAMKQHCKATKR